MGNLTTLYVEVAGDPGPFLEYLREEKIHVDEIINGIYMLRSVSDDQQVIIRLRYNVCSTYVKEIK